MSNWININDELPPKDTWVLWFDGKQTMNPNHHRVHIDKINHRCECQVNYFHNYTHWQYLPKPPEE